MVEALASVLASYEERRVQSFGLGVFFGLHIVKARENPTKPIEALRLRAQTCVRGNGR